MDTLSPGMCAPMFRFDWSTEAAEHNWTVVAQFDVDITRAITSQEANLPLSNGSESRVVNLLQPLCTGLPPTLATIDCSTHNWGRISVDITTR